MNEETLESKDQLKIETNLEKYVGSVYAQGPYFEYPSIKYSPKEII